MTYRRSWVFDTKVQGTHSGKSSTKALPENQQRQSLVNEFEIKNGKECNTYQALRERTRITQQKDKGVEKGRDTCNLIGKIKFLRFKSNIQVDFT